MTLAPGTRLGPYQIVDELGEGGMGVVYRARDPRLGRDVAIKIVRGSVAGDHDRRQRFIQEAKAASSPQPPVNRRSGPRLVARWQTSALYED